jgi:hypothetical protein
MFRRVLPMLCLIGALSLLGGCYGSDTNSNGGNTTNTTNANRAATNTTNTTTMNMATGNANATASDEKIGVPECDDFIAKYDACVSSKVPEAARAQYKSGVQQWRDSWRKLAANPQTKATLAQACKTSLESARTSMKSYGCDF